MRRFKVSTLFYLTALACILVQAIFSDAFLECLLAFGFAIVVAAFRASVAGRVAAWHGLYAAVVYVLLIYGRVICVEYQRAINSSPGSMPYFEDGWVFGLVIAPALVFSVIGLVSAVIGYIVGVLVGFCHQKCARAWDSNARFRMPDEVRLG